MSYKKEKKELGIYYAKMLVFIAEEIIAKNVGNEKAGIQKTFSDLQRCGGSVRKNMTYLVTHWIPFVNVHTMGRGRTVGSGYGERSICTSGNTSKMQQKAYFQSYQDRRKTGKAIGNHFKTTYRF